MPSKLLREGDSNDIIIADIGQRYENWQRERAEAKVKGRAPPPPQLTVAEMQAMIDNVEKMKTR